MKANSASLGFFKKLAQTANKVANVEDAPENPLMAKTSNIKQQMPNKYSNLVKAFGKLIPKTLLNTELKSKCRENLDKINEVDTRMASYNKMKDLIVSNGNRLSLEIFLEHLLDNLKSTNPEAKELQTLLIGYCANILGTKFFSNNIVKEFQRILAFCIRNMKERKENINKATAVVLVEIYDSALKIKDKTIFEKLFGDTICNNIEKYSSNGAVMEGIALLAYEFITYFNDGQNNEMTKYILDKWVLSILVFN